MVQVLTLQHPGLTTSWRPVQVAQNWLVYKSGPEQDAPYTPVRFL